MNLDLESKEAEELELNVMAYRYLYYVVCSPAIADCTYDQYELQARLKCPPNSPVHNLGSDLVSSYTEQQIARANELFKEQSLL